MSVADEKAVEALRYPVGRFTRPAGLNPEERGRALDALEQFPAAMRAAVKGLSPAQLETPYREGGWTLRQLVHHVADSHQTANARIRLALTEEWPTVKPYSEAAWAELEDAKSMPVELSLGLLDGLHARWVGLLRSLPEEAWKRGYRHPEMGDQTVEQVLALYDWHSRHHLAHATGLRQRNGW